MQLLMLLLAMFPQHHRKAGPYNSSAFSLIQKATSAVYCTTSPCTVSLGSNATAGNLIDVVTNFRASNSNVTVSDTPNGTYTQAGGAGGTCSTGTNRTATAYVLSGAGGATTISISYTSLTWAMITVREHHSTTAVTYGSHVCTTTVASTTTPTSDSLNSTFANNLFVGGFVDSASPTYGCGSPWGDCASLTNPSKAGLSETQLNLASGSRSANFTMTVGDTTWMASNTYFHD